MKFFGTPTKYNPGATSCLYQKIRTACPKLEGFTAVADMERRLYAILAQRDTVLGDAGALAACAGRPDCQAFSSNGLLFGSLSADWVSRPGACFYTRVNV
ncbi:hypothetical protein GPECTOR_27g661 [Gonium pectorale]|uniref:Apple domain-containing protein n=1 Tax=Gonium pectorale TaxID=33097 RepID=A0A150GF58_GONPE|nr:hypothetical protein GPECTOR_27g661 [Gonium pectorale]|eukprot:KXZ48491.1 hypothetical protein GPECTOR_27g661 [Gonium pectorale]